MNMEQNRFLIITGMSGAGKTLVLRTLEDLNYFCVDNLPVMLISKFAELCRQTPGRNAAMVVDIRGGNFSHKFTEVLAQLKDEGTEYELLFLDADDANLVRRYKETRRRHPLEQGKLSLMKSVEKERRYLADIKAAADRVINTSNVSLKNLKTLIRKDFTMDNNGGSMLIMVQSFGFKYGLPLDSDVVMDVRFLPNPFYLAELRQYTGNDEGVCKYLETFPQTQGFLRRELDMLDFLLPQYEEEGKSQLVISVGCTGGQHRSVYIANRIYEYLSKKKEFVVELMHRDLPKKELKAVEKKI